MNGLGSVLPNGGTEEKYHVEICLKPTRLLFWIWNGILRLISNLCYWDFDVLGFITGAPYPLFFHPPCILHIYTYDKVCKENRLRALLWFDWIVDDNLIFVLNRTIFFSLAESHTVKEHVRALLGRHRVVYGDLVLTSFDDLFLQENVKSVSICDTEYNPDKKVYQLFSY